MVREQQHQPTIMAFFHIRTLKVCPRQYPVYAIAAVNLQ
jgi:hypothetical protein